MYCFISMLLVTTFIKYIHIHTQKCMCTYKYVYMHIYRERGKREEMDKCVLKPKLKN